MSSSIILALTILSCLFLLMNLSIVEGEYNLFTKIFLIIFFGLLIWLTSAYSNYNKKYVFVGIEKAEIHKEIGYIFFNKRVTDLNKIFKTNIKEGDKIFILKEKELSSFGLLFGDEETFYYYNLENFKEFIKNDSNKLTK